MTDHSSLPSLRATDVGEFVRYRSCERRFKLSVNNRAEAKTLPFYQRLFNTLDVVLRKVGHEREDTWAESLRDHGLVDLLDGRPEDSESNHPDWEEFATAVRRQSASTSGFAAEVRLKGKIGAFDVSGRADFLLIVWRDGAPRLRVVECKASRRDRTYHRIQLAIYVTILKNELHRNPMMVDGHILDGDAVDAIVARIDETTNSNQEILSLPPLDLHMEKADLLRLLATDGALVNVVQTDIEDLGFRLESKCDDCVFNVHCLSESGRQHRLELTGCNVSSASVLRRVGINALEDLGELDPESEEAANIRNDPGFADDLDHLIVQARTRATTLPRAGMDAPDGAYPVTPMPNSSESRLPPHEIHGERLIRVYLGVDYDYTENRIGALTAHVTASGADLRTKFQQNDGGRWAPDPAVYEVSEDDSEQPITQSPVQMLKLSEWSGDYQQDNGAEKELIQNFLRQLINNVTTIANDPAVGGAGDGYARIHFYVWSRSEMTQLVEACTRTSSSLLRALRELMGCRPGTEQLIYTAVQDEVDARFAFGWTGRGLSVLTSLSWFGQRFHWTRKVNGKAVPLDTVFTQDIFDFKTTLALDSEGAWSTDRSRAGTDHRFEIRSRFHDTLPAPYWHAVWGTLPDRNDPATPAEAKGAIARYETAGANNMLEAYLEARAHALRWIEERVKFKNEDLDKPRIDVASLSKFSLGVSSTRAAAIDFLRLDHAVKLSDWVSAHMLAVRGRIQTGKTLPLRELDFGDKHIVAQIDAERLGLDTNALSSISAYGAKSMVRIHPYSGDAAKGQSFKQLTNGGLTCTVVELDWAQGRVVLEPIKMQAASYILTSFDGILRGNLFATMDQSVSEFVARRVDTRLSGDRGDHVEQWFNPEKPQIPAVVPLDHAVTDPLAAAFADDANGEALLSPTQGDAVAGGLNARVHLLQGPPGTGKTQTTAVAVLAQVAARLQSGDVVIVGAHTHTAVDTLLQRIAAQEADARSRFAAHGIDLPSIRLAKAVRPDDPSHFIGDIGQDINPKSCLRVLKNLTKEGVVVVGGTTSALLQMFGELDKKKSWIQSGGFVSPLLVIDEASMMVFPHFLALTTATNEDSCIMLAGDHRQLAPIVAHDWDSEDRPPTVRYQPFVSAFEAVRRIAAEINDPARVSSSALQKSFRLPASIVELLKRLYALDDIELEGSKITPPQVAATGVKPKGLAGAWAGTSGLYLVVHDERESRQSNRFEAELIRQLAESAPNAPEGSIAVITPHRAQRSVLENVLKLYSSVGLIDTVERLQGGERPTVIVSGTVSEPGAISQTEQFILNLNRSNVAFSRSQDRLIVVCSRALLDHVPADAEVYEATMLWKSLRTWCSEIVGDVLVDGHRVQVLTVPARGAGANA